MKNWLDLDFTLSRDLQEKTRKQFKLFSWVQFKQVWYNMKEGQVNTIWSIRAPPYNIQNCFANFHPLPVMSGNDIDDFDALGGMVWLP